MKQTVYGDNIQDFQVSGQNHGSIRGDVIKFVGTAIPTSD